MNRLLTVRALVAWLVLTTGSLLMAAGCARVPRKVAAHPAVGAANSFVGNAACAECHPAEFRSHRASRHARTLRVMTRAALGDLAPPTGTIAGTPYRIQELQDGFVFTSARQGGSVPPLQLAFGSGKTGMTYVRLLDDRTVLESRLSYFPHLRTWSVTPGQEDLADTDPGFVHKPEAARRCLLCHAVTMPADRLMPESQFFGVGCESCHGPGSAHIASVKSGRSSDLHMEKIGRWGATRVNELCARCHRGRKDINLSSIEVTMTNRFQPYGLMMSRCFQQSHDTLSCLTCHDPHANASTDMKTYEAVCLTCHAAPSATTPSSAGGPAGIRGRSCPINLRAKCIGCHMPARRVFQDAHISTTMADHLILSHQ